MALEDFNRKFLPFHFQELMSNSELISRIASALIKAELHERVSKNKCTVKCVTPAVSLEIQQPIKGVGL